MTKHQVVVIHGGETFDTYDAYLDFLKAYNLDPATFDTKGWKSTLADALGDAYEVIAPKMPSSLNAKFLEWSIWFEKFIPLLRDDVILVGHSLGGIFLAKYLSLNDLPIRVRATLFIAAPYTGSDAYSLADFELPPSLSRLQEQGGTIHLYHSADDPVVPFLDLKRYTEALPNAVVHIFHDRGHFVGETFPEIVEDIQASIL